MYLKCSVRGNINTNGDFTGNEETQGCNHMNIALRFCKQQFKGQLVFIAISHEKVLYLSTMPSGIAMLMTFRVVYLNMYTSFAVHKDFCFVLRINMLF